MSQHNDLWPGEMYDMLALGSQIKYRIYPSLLDKYQQVADYEQEAEAPWNRWSESSLERARLDADLKLKAAVDSLHQLQHDLANTSDKHERMMLQRQIEGAASLRKKAEDEIARILFLEPGDYILSPEEKLDQLEQELIDTINRVPHEPSIAADRGTALNEIVDCMVMGVPCERADMTIQSIKAPGAGAVAIRADYDGFTFDFDPALCRQLRDLLQGSMCQAFLKAPFMTSLGGVELYGFADYWIADKIIDLKTTSQYEFGKYSRKWQRHAYPWIAVETGLATEISEFTYLVAVLSKGKIISGKIYNEVYTYDHRQSESALRSMLESFINWLEAHRDKITDTKIFNKKK